MYHKMAEPRQPCIYIFFCIRGMHIHVFYFLLPTCLSFINIKNYIEYNGFPSSHLKVIVAHVPDTVIQGFYIFRVIIHRA